MSIFGMLWQTSDVPVMKGNFSCLWQILADGLDKALLRLGLEHGTSAKKKAKVSESENGGLQGRTVWTARS
jgi:hypothetical protein